MTRYRRRQSLIDLLKQHQDLRVSDLAEALNVSEGTVRNDLNALEAEGKLRRVHGGAVLQSQELTPDSNFSRRYLQNIEAKRVIARAAAQYVNDEDSILLDASSTDFYLARMLSARQSLRVVTNGFDVARELAQNTSNNVILIGGVVNNNSSSVTGLLSERIIEDLHINKAFLSCSGFTIESGMTEVHLAEAQLKRKIIASTDHLYALIDSSKFGKADLTSFAKADKITRLFTDNYVADEWKMILAQAGIEVSICDEGVVTK